MKRIVALLMCCASVVLAGGVFAQDDSTDMTEYETIMRRMFQEVVDAADAISSDVPTIERIAESGDPLYIAPLLDIAYFTRTASMRSVNGTIFQALQTLTGQNFGLDWRLYFEWASENDIDLPPGYDAFKGFLFGTLIDPNFEVFFQDVQETAQVNLLEAVWGGVRVDGIPSLVNAPQVSPEDAALEGELFTQFCRDGDCTYPAPEEFVFGVSLNGDNRAYPLRQLNWHEMFNDVIGRVPLYDAPDGEQVCFFRAPTEFNAVAHSGGEWVQIIGESAGCPTEGGWLAEPDTLIWGGEDAEIALTWDEVLVDLPDVSEDGAEALAFDEGVIGQVDGMPIMLAYCTLCGSGVLYDPTIDNLVVDGESLGETTLEFGSTGMLMRSNKLMYDRNTDTVWNALTGTVAFGPLAETGLELERLPVVVTDWQSWLAEHPDTSVLSLNTGFQRNYTNGAAYSDYFNDPDFIMFPVWQQDVTENENKEMVFTLLLEDTPKAYPLRTIIPEAVTNDTLAGTDLVIVSRESATREFFEPGGASVRAYERGDNTFSPGEERNQIIDQDGNIWEVTESALIGPDGEELPRLPGHLAFWFGWFSFYPETLVYEVQ